MVSGLCIRRLPVSVMLVFVWSSSVVIPVSVLVAVVPVLKAIISLIKPVLCWWPLFPLLSLLKFCLLWLSLKYPLLFLKFGLEMNDELYEMFLLEDLSKDPLKDPSDDQLVYLVLTAFMSQSWNELSSSLICVSTFAVVCSLHLLDAASTKEDSLSISLACLKASSSVLM